MLTLPTNDAVLDNFFIANDHYAIHSNHFSQHTPYPCQSYAAGVPLRAQGVHEHLSSSIFLGGLSMININPSSIHMCAILESGATSYFLVLMAPKEGVTPASNPLSVSLPNGDTSQSTSTCTLALPKLPEKRGRVTSYQDWLRIPYYL